MFEKIYHIITDLAGNYTYINPHFKERFGFMHADFVGIQSIKSIHPIDAHLAIEATERLLTGKSSVENLELRKPKSDGTYFWTYWEFKLIYCSQNQPVGICCIGYDISKHKSTEIDNFIVSKLINNSSVITNLSSFRYDILADNIQLSNEFYEIYNLQKSENITLLDIFKKIHPEDLPFVDLSLITELKNSKKIIVKQFRILDPGFEGGIKHIESIFEYYYNIISQKEYVFGLAFDISKIRKKENEYSLIISHLKSILDTNENSVAVINKDYKLITYNLESVKVAERFGVTPFVGQYILEYIPDDYKSRIISFYERVFKGESIKLDFNIIYESGQFLSDIYYYPLRNETNEVEFMVINCKFNDLCIFQPNEKIKIAKSIIDFQEVEKNRIATDLHDSVNQLLYVARINIKQLEESKEKTAVLELLDKASLEIKSIINNSSHFLLENTSFEDSINHYLSTIFKDSNIKHRIKFLNNIKTELSSDLKLNIFRIIQEISQNVHKHSSAKLFKVKIKIYCSILILLTSDDGSGFEYTQLSKGKGLTNIKNRVAFMNGNLKMITKFNKGTLFAIAIPINN